MNIPSINRKTFIRGDHFPEPGSADERAMFNKIQEGMKRQYEQIFPDKLAERTVVIVTHDDRAATYGTRLIRLRDGKLA